MKKFGTFAPLGIGIGIGVVLVAAAVLARQPAAPESNPMAAELVLRDGRFHTVDTPGTVDGSLAIRDGRIVFLGPTAELGEWVGTETEVLDLAGRAVTPGLIDAHAHLASLGDVLTQVDLTGSTSYAEVVARVAAAAAATPPGTWIRGRGWDQNDWPGGAFPRHEPLSEAVPAHPVWLTRIDGHAALLNAPALALSGIDAATPDPPGGRLERDAEGAPTGVLVDAAMGLAAPALPRPSVETIAEGIRRAVQLALGLGLTTVSDMGVDAPTLAAYGGLADRGALGMRVAAFIDDDARQLASWFERGPHAFDGRLLVRGVKLYADGALGSRGAALVEDYTDDAGNRGLLITDGARIEQICRQAIAAGFQIGVHAIGDRGNQVVLDAFERCFEGRSRPELRFRVEHAQVLRPADIRRFAALGVFASMQPTHATSDMPWAPARLGPERIKGAYAWRSLLTAGAPLAFGSDFPVESPDPRLGLYAAVTRQDLEGRPPGGWMPDQRLSRAEALRAFTLDAARSLFLDDEVGSLRPGKRADLVIWGADPLVVPDRELKTVPIDATLLDGEVVFRREGG